MKHFLYLLPLLMLVACMAPPPPTASSGKLYVQSATESEALNPKVFDWEYYYAYHSDLNTLPYFRDVDLTERQKRLQQHWFSNGIDEGRQGHPQFHTKTYLNNYADLRNAFCNPSVGCGASGSDDYRQAVGHYINQGIQERRTGVAENALPMKLADSRVYNLQFYLDSHEDLKNHFQISDPTILKWRVLEHWLLNGVYEARQAHGNFDSKAYLNRYSDLRSAFCEGITPCPRTGYRKAIEHYLDNGISEGRSGSPLSSPPDSPTDELIPPEEITAAIDASVTPPTAFAGGEVEFSGAGSVGNDLTYRWDFGDGKVMNGDPETNGDAVHIYEHPGYYNATLTVFDLPTATTKTSTVRIAVMPDIHDIPSSRALKYGESVVLNVKYPAEKVIYEWLVDESPLPNGPEAIPPIKRLGFHDVRLKIWDQRAGVCYEQCPLLYEAETRFNVTAEAPVASLTHDKVNNLEFSFDASLSEVKTAPDKNSLKYVWNFGDGITQETLTPKISHVYDKKGVYGVRLNVVDQFGQMDTTAAVVVADDFGDRNLRVAFCMKLATTCDINTLAKNNSLLETQSLDDQNFTKELYSPVLMHSEGPGAAELIPNSVYYRTDYIHVHRAREFTHNGYDINPLFKGCSTDGSGTYCTRAEMNLGRTVGKNSYTFSYFYGSKNSVATSQESTTMHYTVFESIKIPQYIINIIPDTQIEKQESITYNYETYIEGTSGSPPGGIQSCTGVFSCETTKMVTVVNIPESSVGPNGEIKFTIPMYLVNKENKLMEDATGYLAGRFLSGPNIQSKIKDNIIIKGVGEIEISTTVNPSSTDTSGSGSLPSTDKFFLESGVCSDAYCFAKSEYDYSENLCTKASYGAGGPYSIARLSEGYFGCSIINTYDSIPYAVSQQPVGSQSLGALNLPANNRPTVRVPAGSVKTQVKYGKDKASRFNLDKFLRDFDGSGVRLALGWVPILGDSVDLLTEVTKAAIGQKADPVICVLASIGLALDVTTGGVGDITAPIKMLYKAGGNTSKEVIRALIDSVGKLNARDAFSTLKNSAIFIIDVGIKGNMRVVDDALRLAREGSTSVLGGLNLFTSSYSTLKRDVPAFVAKGFSINSRIKVAKYGMFAPETAKAMAKCGSGCITSIGKTTEYIKSTYSKNVSNIVKKLDDYLPEDRGLRPTDRVNSINNTLNPSACGVSVALGALASNCPKTFHTSRADAFRAKFALRATNGKKLGQNLAFADIHINGSKEIFTLIANSGPKIQGTTGIPAVRRYQTTKDAQFDSEVKILETLATHLRPDASGIIQLYSDKAICPSCLGVIEQFKKDFPNIQFLEPVIRGYIP